MLNEICFLATFSNYGERPIGLNELVAVLVPDFDDFVAHQISVEDRNLVGGQVVKEDLRLVNLFGFRQIRTLRKFAPERIQHQLGQGA